MFHKFFIHSSVNGHLHCFHILAIANSAAMKNGIHVYFSILIPSGYLPGSRMAVSHSGFIPSFLRTLHTVFHSGCIILHSQQQCTPSPAFIVFRLLDDEHSDWCDVIYHFFHFHFSNNEQYCASFHCSLAICMSSSEKCMFRSSDHFFDWASCFSEIEFHELLVYLGN